MDEPLAVYVARVMAELGPLRGECWARKWVFYRMELSRKYFGGRIMSTAHNDIFGTILRCLKGAKWLEPSEELDKSKSEENQYGKNFRAVIKEALALEKTNKSLTKS